MKANKYQKLAMRTNDGKCTDRLAQKISGESILKYDGKEQKTVFEPKAIDVGGIINASLGLSGETGELNDMIKKTIFHGHSIDLEKVKKEIGDIMWYVAMMCDSFGFEMEEVMQMNIDKLKARYPEGISEYDSQHRKEGDNCLKKGRLHNGSEDFFEPVEKAG